MNRADMPALLVSHRRPGIYFRVIEEGEVSAGDTIRKLSSGPRLMSVVEIDALLYSSSHPAEALRRAAAIPALSGGWQTSIKAPLEANERGAKSGNAGFSPIGCSTLAWPGLRELVIVATERASEEVRCFELTSRDAPALPYAAPGQYLSLRVRPDKSGLPVVRNYSLCGPPGSGHYRIAVKQEPHSSVSSYLHGQVKQGDTLEVLAPRGKFTLRSGDGPLVLRSAGIGVTPVLAMLHATAGSARVLWWIHVAANQIHFEPTVKQTSLGRSAQPHLPAGAQPTSGHSDFRTQRPHRSLGFPLRQPARVERGL
jgi:hypothetical protein